VALVDSQDKQVALAAVVQEITPLVALELVVKEITVAMDYFKAVQTQVVVEVDGVQLVVVQQQIKLVQVDPDNLHHTAGLVLLMQVVEVAEHKVVVLVVVAAALEETGHIRTQVVMQPLTLVVVEVAVEVAVEQHTTD
jgi:hypothetical protein